MQAISIPKSELDLVHFKPIEISQIDNDEPGPVIRTPSPVKTMVIGISEFTTKCETKYFDAGMKRPREEKMLRDGKIHGIYKRWHDNGTLCEESVYSNGKLNGKQTYYSIHGTVMHEFNYTDGLMNGPQTSFYTNGRLMSRLTYKNGIMYGEKSTYYKCGTLKTLETFNDQGLIVGTAREWHPNGRLARDATYIDGKLHGMYFEYNAHDIPTRAMYFEHGTIVAMCR